MTQWKILCLGFYLGLYLPNVGPVKDQMIFHYEGRIRKTLELKEGVLFFSYFWLHETCHGARIMSVLNSLPVITVITDSITPCASESGVML